MSFGFKGLIMYILVNVRGKLLIEIWDGHVAYMREIKNAYKISAEKPEGKRPLGNHGVDG
jgi:hypothetical protein